MANCVVNNFMATNKHTETLSLFSRSFFPPEHYQRPLFTKNQPFH